MIEQAETTSPALERKDFGQLLGEWRNIFSHCVSETEKFTREKPSAGLAIAFLAGTVLSSLWRKR
jgi:hypothetical protein